MKREFDYPVAVLTNGSLLHEADVARALLHADVVLPTLGADDETTFQCVHRPHKDLHFQKVIQGICDFATQYKNHLWLEVVLLDGITAIKKTVDSMKKTVDLIKPEKVQVNTATRPAVEDFAFPVPPSRLAALTRQLGPKAEIIAEYKGRSTFNDIAGNDTHNALLGLLHRRPCTKDDIADALQLHPLETLKLLESLSEKGILQVHRHHGKSFYIMPKWQ